MTRNDVLHQNRTAAGSSRRHEGARLDLVRNDGVAAAVQALHAADLDHVRARALDVCAERVQEVRQIDDMRLLCAVLHDGLALCQNRCEHDVHGRADGDNVEINMCAVQAVLGRLDPDVTALGQSDLGAERLEALDVLVDRTNAAEVAAAWHCYLGKAVLAEQHAEQIVGGAQLALELVRLERRILGVLDLHSRGIDQTDLCAELAHDLHLERHVDDLRHVFDADRAIREQSRRYDGHCCILRARNRYFTVQRLAAVDYIFGQSQPTPHCTVPHPTWAFF